MDWSEKSVDKHWESVSEARRELRTLGSQTAPEAVNTLCQLKTLYLFFVDQKYLG